MNIQRIDFFGVHVFKNFELECLYLDLDSSPLLRSPHPMLLLCYCVLSYLLYSLGPGSILFAAPAECHDEGTLACLNKTWWVLRSGGNSDFASSPKVYMPKCFLWERSLAVFILKGSREG